MSVSTQNNVAAEKKAVSSSVAVSDSYGKKLYRYAREVQDPHFLEFTSLQRINILGLQNELARQKAEIAKTESVSDTQLLTLRLTLRDYGTSLST